MFFVGQFAFVVMVSIKAQIYIFSVLQKVIIDGSIGFQSIFKLIFWYVFEPHTA